MRTRRVVRYQISQGMQWINATTLRHNSHHILSNHLQRHSHLVHVVTGTFLEYTVHVPNTYGGEHKKWLHFMHRWGYMYTGSKNILVCSHKAEWRACCDRVHVSVVLSSPLRTWETHWAVVMLCSPPLAAIYRCTNTILTKSWKTAPTARNYLITVNRLTSMTIIPASPNNCLTIAGTLPEHRTSLYRWYMENTTPLVGMSVSVWAH